MNYDEAWIPPADDSQPVQPVQPDQPVTLGGGSRTGRMVLERVYAWLGTYVSTVQESDLELLTLWAAHTHLCVETFTTPRLLLDSPVPGSGKTTTLEHLHKLCLSPVQMATLSSPAMLARLLDAGLRTLLIDEADRSLAPDKEGIGDLLAVLNSGYKRGGTRPVLTPGKDGAWIAKEMPTFCPVVMAGNSPNLPEDTRSRSIRVVLMPDIDGSVLDSEWEYIEDDARRLGERLAAWADEVRDEVRLNRPTLPEGIKGRARERWAPLKRVADAAGGRWPAVVDQLAVEDLAEQALQQEEGIVNQRPHVVLMAHLAEVWPDGSTFIPTKELINALVDAHPDTWGESSSFGKRLNEQRLGRMLSGNYKIHSDRPGGAGPRGYTLAALSTAFRRFGLTPSSEPVRPVEPAEPVTAPSVGLTPQTKPVEPVEPVMTRETTPRCTTCSEPLDGAAVTVGTSTCSTCELRELTR